MTKKLEELLSESTKDSARRESKSRNPEDKKAEDKQQSLQVQKNTMRDIRRQQR